MGTRPRTPDFSLFTFALLLVFGGAVHAACDTPVGEFVSITGSVDVQSTRAGGWSAAALSTQLCEGDTIRVGERSRAAVSLINEAVLRIDQNTALRLIDITPAEQETSLLDMVRGAFQSFSRKPKFLKVNTPYLNGSVEGTEFAVRTDEGKTSITVFEGVVVAANPQGEVAVRPGESAEAAQGQAPQIRIVVRPRDLVQWALYYPPILSLSALADASPALEKAANCAANGNTACAFDALEEVPPADRDARYLVLKASLLLSVGRVDQARAAIDDALQRNPNESAAYALRAVIGVVLNENEKALADGHKAVELDPASSSAAIALSYALQAEFQIEAARDTMQTAVEQNPDDALALARLAELELMLGARAKALELAQKANAMSPGQARTELVLGFNALALFRNDEAKAAFERAIAAESADPLAHLGLGLAKISAGQVEDGRGDLEAAVALDSNNALLRAYLGKAYFEERRYPLDSDQYSIAKQLDPNDPTAYLYDGILKQTVNRPVEAVEDLERSIELNDNRAVYRSRLLLDKDRAARGTSLARAYKDLGFTQLGINESTKSVTVDPASASAHRFLSDTYRGVRRVEISRVSELLQAQLLQDININPVQPSISATNLNVATLGGPSSPGFNEYTPLFQQNQTQLNVTGFGGNKDTYGGEAVITGLYDWFSFSLGGFKSDTDGWRSNNDLDQDLYNVFLQAAATSEINVQFEYQHRHSKAGDLPFNFDPDSYLDDLTDKRDEDTTRVGVRLTPEALPDSTILLSYIHNKRDEDLELADPLNPFETLFLDSEVEDDGDQFQAQYIHKWDGASLIIGGDYAKLDRHVKDMFVIEDIDFGVVDMFGGEFDQDVKHKRGYAYTNIQTNDGAVVWTIGASYDDYEEDILEEDEFNPKFGVQWDVNESVRLRAAAFRVLKPLLTTNRTIEPTQVAGFNQFFDDANGSKSWRYGAGIDHRASRNLWFGGEATWRDIKEPQFIFFEDPPRTSSEDIDETLHRLYAYWTPTSTIGVTGQLVYDLFKRETGLGTERADDPKRVRTVSVPVGVNYFAPSGLFAGVTGTFVDQEVERSDNAFLADGEDNFFLVDLAVGYRFPKRRGSASIAVQNVFDKDFHYQDDNFREFRSEATTGPYFPERLIRASVTLSF